MSLADRPHLVYVRNFANRVETQKWATLDFGVGRWKQPSVVDYYPLTELEFKMSSIAELEKKYPSRA